MTDTLFDDNADARLKQNVSAITGSLAKIVALSAKSYKLITSPSETRYGFTAQEFVTQFPELTYYNTGVDNGTDPISLTNYPWMIDLVPLIPHLTVAMREQNTVVSSHATSIASNSSAITALQGSSLTQSSGSGNLGTPTYGGTSGPSGTVTKVYQWYKIGNVCNLFYAIKGSVAGLLTTSMSVALPGDAPTPANLSNQINDSWVSLGSGAILAAASASLTGNNCGLYKTSGGSYELRNYATAALSAVYITGQITYMTT